MKKILILSSLMFLYSCVNNKGTSTGNPLVTVSMTGSQSAATAAHKIDKMRWFLNQAYAFTPPATIQDLSNASVSLSEFWLNISNIEFKPNEVADVTEVDGDEVKLTGPFTVNIFSNSPQNLGSTVLNQSVMRRIKYKTKKVLDVASGNPAGMVNYSIYLSGSVGSNNFIFKSGEELEFITAGPTAVSLGSGSNVLMQLNTADLIRKINLSSVVNGDVISESSRKNFVNPCPAIDASASDLYTCFIKGIQLQTKIGKDDGDSVFEPGETTAN